MKNVTASAELTSEKGIYTNDNFINDGNKVDAYLSLSYDDILKNNSWMSGAWVK